MEPFTRLRAVAAPLPLDNVDTDQILPARFLSQKRELGYADYCFRDLRQSPEGVIREDFPLNQPAYRDARILVAGINFGCGSSREGAVYALADIGVRAIIAESFGDIFFQNALINGLLPIVLKPDQVKSILARVAQPGAGEVEIDLDEQRITVGSSEAIAFSIDPFRKHCLLSGIDEIDFTRQFIADIEAFERRPAEREAALA